MNKDRFHNHIGQEIGFTVDDWHECQLPSHTDMNGHFCRLEVLNVDKHAEDLYHSFSEDSNQHNWTYLPYGPFNDYESFYLWLEDTCLGIDPLFHAVIDQRTQSAVGLASYLRINPKVGVIEVGHIHFSPKLQQTAMSTEAMYLMMQRVFDELGYRRYEWKCDALNAKSRKSAQRLGFTFEAVFRQATMYKGRNRDTAWYAIIDSDWPKIKQAFQNWLDPENFDKSGQQKTKLQMILDLDN